jgi:NitT/TauT family transport system substrate-binding protein
MRSKKPGGKMTKRAICTRKTFCSALGALMIVWSMAQAAAAKDDVRVRFSYKLKGEYGLFYMGQAKGAYSDAGLTVRFGEGAGSQAALGGLLQDQDDLIVLPGIFAISAIQKGMPIKIIALYQPAAPAVLISQPENPVATPKDLEGKTLATPVGETGTTYLNLFCETNKVDCSRIKKVQIDVQARVAQFLANHIDVIGAYTTNDLPALEERVGKKFVVLDQVKYGLAVPGMAVVASDAGLKTKKDQFKKFLTATAAAIEMARKDPDGASAALKAAWPNSPSDTVVKTQIINTSVSIPVGPGRPTGWIEQKAIDNALKLIGSVEDIGSPKPPANFYTNELLSP